MYSFITLRCCCCGTVMYNLPDYEIGKLEHSNLVCEDCSEHNADEIYNIINELECLMCNGKNTQHKKAFNLTL